MQLADTAEQIQLNNRDRHLIIELMPETEGRWVPGVEPGHATGKSKEGYSYEPSFELLIFIYPPLSIFNSISDTQSIFNSILDTQSIFNSILGTQSIFNSISDKRLAAHDVQSLQHRLSEDTRANVVWANTLGVALSCDSPVHIPIFSCAVFFDPKLHPLLAVTNTTDFSQVS